jgi:hypothetical protein
VITSASDGSFNQFGIGVWYSSMVAIAREDTDAIKIGCCNFVVRLLDRAKGFASAIDMVWC